MKVLSVVLIGLVCLSCEEILFEKELSGTDPWINLEYLWDECNQKYAYFELKQVDWDQVKSEHEAMLYHGMTQDSLFKVLGSMLTRLKDDHANLRSNFNTSFYGVEYTAQDNFDWRIIVDHYIGQDYYLSGPFAHDFLAGEAIGYIRFPSFVSEIKKQNLDFILNRYKDTNGLILDIRENGGGAIANVFVLLSRFVNASTVVNYAIIKTGPAHDDFSDPEPVIVEPHDGIRYEKPVMVLTDRGTYSSGSLLALATKALPNVTLVGDTTGGGLGMPNGGQLPNGWSYRFSITQSLTLDHRPDYENGVPADVPTQLDWSDLTRDEILEEAIKLILD